MWVHTPPAVQRSPVFSVSPPTPILCLCFVLNEDVLMGVDFDGGVANGHPEHRMLSLELLHALCTDLGQKAGTQFSTSPRHEPRLRSLSVMLVLLCYLCDVMSLFPSLRRFG